MKDHLHTPWSDELTLIYESETKDASGYRNPVQVPADTPLLCNFTDGVSQSEFYRSRKAGMQADAEAEVWAVDYDSFWPEEYAGRRLCRLNGTLYQVIRAFRSSMDYKTLILSEVIR
ncbi:MAG: hypothetical protein J6S60_06160 [Oscillospiraceae bacterium]|nr:hypothetical protein [Oscillospiraceae bacterium]